MNHRRSPRQPRPLRLKLQLAVRYSLQPGHEREEKLTFCRDLSSEGVLLELIEPTLVGSSIQITLLLPDTRQKLQLTGQVQWQKLVSQSTPDGTRDSTAIHVGIQFHSLEPEIKAALEGFLKRNHSKAA